MNSIQKKQVIRKIQRNIKNNNFTRIKANDNFYKFYDKLQEHFSSHNMMGVSLTMKNKSFYTLNQSVKRSKAIKIFDQQLCNITILPKQTGIELYRLEMYKTGQGLGSSFIEIFNKISKETGIVIYLIPGDPGFSTEGDDEKRRRFYHKHGFRRCSDSKFWSNELMITASKYNL